MATWTAADRAQAADLVALTWANPFTPQRLQLERRLLGQPPPSADAVWHPQADADDERFARLARLAENLLARAPAQAVERDGLLVYALYYRFIERLDRLARAEPGAEIGWFSEFAAAQHELSGQAMPRPELEHLLACLLQVRRTFAAIFAQLVGASAPMARLRAACWQAVFGADLQRYRRCLWERMRDFPALVCGPSGTGKELVARVIGGSGYLPVDGRRDRLGGVAGASWLPLSISALPATLVEAELFGHRRGAFTGAAEERAGWLEVCPAHGCVFLDEIGEVDPAVQVKLLRVLQTRRFARVGEHAERIFAGRLVAATNRDLAAEIDAGRFRADVYYRLCATQVTTPALRELLDADARELDRLALALAERIVGPSEAAAVAGEGTAWIRRHLGEGYDWPGNVRELEQCLRNLLVRGSYHPATADEDFAATVRAGRLTAEELLDRYCAQESRRTGGWRAAGRRLGIDWRTVKLRALRSGAVGDAEGDMDGGGD
jgi:transcriptional regulator with AAA-type ATPase domain